MEAGDHAWELSKENVQPIKRGRAIGALTAALHAPRASHDAKRQ